MNVTPITPPLDVVNVGVFGGHWYQMQGTGATAIVYWKGGPDSGDPDIIIHWIEAEVRKQGFGALLVAEILEWADARNLAISLFCEKPLGDWWRRRGFVYSGGYREGVIMGRRAKSTT